MSRFWSRTDVPLLVSVLRLTPEESDDGRNPRFNRGFNGVSGRNNPGFMLKTVRITVRKRPKPKVNQA